MSTYAGHPQTRAPEVAPLAPEQLGGCEQTRGLRGPWGQQEGGQGQAGGWEQMTALGRKRRASDERLRGGGAGREEQAGKGFTVINLSLLVPAASDQHSHGRGPETRGLQEVQ